MPSWLVKVPFVLLFVVFFTEAYCWVLVPRIQVGPSFKQPDAELGMVQRRSYSGRRYTHEYDMRWSTGAQGFRGSDYTRDKASGVVRIASLGNSHTFGVGVQDDETYSAVAERALGEAEVINMSVTDAGTGILLRTWDDILSYSPDALVIRYDAWNFQDPFKQFKAGDGPLEPRQHPPRTNILSVLEASPLRHSATWGFLRLRYPTIKHGLSQTKCRATTLRTVRSTACVPKDDTDARIRRAAQEDRLLAELSRRIQDLEIPVVVVRFKLTDRQLEVFERHLPQLDNVSVLDFSHTVGDPVFHFPIDKHLNVNGHAVVGAQVAEELRKRL